MIKRHSLHSYILLRNFCLQNQRKANYQQEYLKKEFACLYHNWSKNCWLHTSTVLFKYNSWAYHFYLFTYCDFTYYYCFFITITWVCVQCIAIVLVHTKIEYFGIQKCALNFKQIYSRSMRKHNRNCSKNHMRNVIPKLILEDQEFDNVFCKRNVDTDDQVSWKV